MNDNNTGSSGKSSSALMQNVIQGAVVVAVVVALYFVYSAIAPHISCLNTGSGVSLPLKDIAVHSAETYSGDSVFLSSSALESSISDFYAATGIEPYLLVLPEDEYYEQEELQTAADEFYEDTFSDEGHFVIVFKLQDDSYIIAYHVGEDAKAALNDSALTQFGDYVSAYYSLYKNKQADVFPTVFEAMIEWFTTGTASLTTFLIIAIGIFVAYIFVKIMMARSRAGLNSGSIYNRFIRR